jgi:hypothetical protein
MRSNNKNSITNEERNERDYEIIKRLKEVIHKEDENQDPVIIQMDEIEEVPFYKNKYFIIGGVIIGSFIS